MVIEISEIGFGELFEGDCLEIMKNIPDKSIDMVLCDLPYGTTSCKWDTVIPFDVLWDQYNRISKDNAAIVLTAVQPFTSFVIMSNLNNFKYCWIWEKSSGTGFLDTKKRPLKCHEDVIVFYYKQPIYNPQKWKGEPNHGCKTSVRKTKSVYAGDYGRPEPDISGMKYPRSVIKFKKHSSSENLHTTQKPIALFEYLIKTYTNEGALVLDNCAGSGTTGIACLNTNRKFILIEKEHEYVEIIKERIEKHLEEKKEIKE